MLDFNSSLERYNSNGYRTPFIFILGSILGTGEQNEMSKARRLFGNRKRRKTMQRFTKFFYLNQHNFSSSCHIYKWFSPNERKIAGTIYISI